MHNTHLTKKDVNTIRESLIKFQNAYSLLFNLNNNTQSDAQFLVKIDAGEINLAQYLSDYLKSETSLDNTTKKNINIELKNGAKSL